MICNSIFSRQKPLSFLISITTRLWIPLLLVTSFSAFVLGPMVSSIGAVEYFQLYFSDALKYVTRSAFFRPLMEIPTVFDTNRLHLINGNIWCISYFFGGYLFLLALWMLGIARKGVNGGVVFIAAAFLLMVYCYHILDLQPLQHKAPSRVLIASILLGAGVCCLKDQISVNYRLPLAFLLLNLTLRKFSPDLAYLTRVLLIFFFCLWLATQPWFQKFKPKINISLGLFLLSYPIQQTWAYFFPESSQPANFALTWVTTAVLAYLSAILIERHCYRLADVLKAKVDRFN